MRAIERTNTINRVNTYLPKEYFKLILIGPNKDRAEELAQWLTGSTTSMRGMYGCPYNKSQMVVFFRSPENIDKQATTVAVEALLLFIESEAEFEMIRENIQKYLRIPVKMIVSTRNLSSIAKSINGHLFPLEDDPKRLKEELNRLDIEECKRIKQQFLQYDTDGSGLIDQIEMKKIAVELGENPDSDEFKQAMLALDFSGDGQISFTEFVAWWKIGRQNTKILPKVYQLEEGSKSALDALINFPSYCKEIAECVKIPDKKTYQRVYYRGTGPLKLKSLLELGVSVGGQKRMETAMKFLSTFTKNTGIAKSNWVSIVTSLKKGSGLTQQESKELLEGFKDNILLWGQTSSNPAIIEFLNNLLVFETSAADNMSILIIRMKLDIEEIIKNSLNKYLFILNNLFNSEMGSFWINLIANSNIDLCGTSGNTIGKFLDVSEILFEGEGFRNRMKTLFSNLTSKSREHPIFKALETILLPLKMDLEFEGKIDEFPDPEVQQILDISLDYLSSLFGVLKICLPKKLMIAAQNIEIGVNMFDVFARFKFNTKNFFTA